MWYMLRSLGVIVKGSAALYGDKEGLIISGINPDADLKKIHVTISYDKLRESAESGIIIPIKVCTTVNQSRILDKSVLTVTMGSFTNSSYVVFHG